MRKLILIAIVLSVGLTTPALAHSGHGASSLLDGLVHPLTGLDHILAFIAVGLLARRSGGTALWAWPLIFLMAAGIGFLVGVNGLALPLIEPGILASVIVLGLIIASELKLAPVLGALLIGLFGVMHGQAHAGETNGTALLPFAVGFLLTSAALHALGLYFGQAILPKWQRWGGFAAATLGVALALS
jgi:urease accessory protein